MSGRIPRALLLVASVAADLAAKFRESRASPTRYHGKA